MYETHFTLFHYSKNKAKYKERTMLTFFSIIQCVKVVISPYLDASKVLYLSHSLKLIPSRLESAKVFWDLDSNDIKFRLRSGKFYLEKTNDNRLLKRDGGKRMEDFDEAQKMDELKILINSDNGPIAREYADSNANTTTANRRMTEDPIVEKGRSNMMSNLMDPISQEYFSKMGDGNALSYLSEPDSAFDKGKKGKDENENNIKNAKSELSTQNELSGEQEEEAKKTEKNAGEEKNKNNKSMLSSNMNGSSTNYSNGRQPRTRGPAVGFDFEIFPVFLHKLEKKILIINGNSCLTHDLSFKLCAYSSFWDLKADFYWDIFKAEDVDYLRKLKTAIEQKATVNEKVKVNQFADTKNCANNCPSGDCDSSETESMESDDTSRGIQRPTFRQQYPFQTPYTNQYPAMQFQQPVYNTPLNYQAPRVSSSKFKTTNASANENEKILIDKKMYFDLLNAQNRNRRY